MAVQGIGRSSLSVRVFKRDLLLHFKQRSEVINPLFFFIIVVSLFPFGIGPEPNTLALIAPGVVWIAALLATLIAADSLFQQDFDDGTLEQMVLSPEPLYFTVMAKVLVHWLVTGFPLTLIAPLLGVLLHLSQQSIMVLVLTLLIGTPVMAFVNAIGAALTVGVRQSGVLIPLIVLPLHIPVLIFATATVQADAEGFTIRGQLSLLLALLLAAATLAPLAISAALKIGVSR